MQADQSEDSLSHGLEALLPSEWERLVRLCGSLSGNADVAEDLAQETLIEAWRHAAQLRDRNALRPWLSGIARNVCLRWARERGRDTGKAERLAQRRVETHAVESGRFDLDLERDELASLLDRAMDLLPAGTRDVLVQRYIDERPHAEIAERLGLSEGAVAVRTHRGKLALKQALQRPELGAEAAAYGLVDPRAIGWQATRIWCPFCGKHRLDARIDREGGDIAYRCAGTCFGDGTLLDIRQTVSGTPALTSAKSILARELVDSHEYYQRALAERESRCHGCGHPVAIERWSSENPPSMVTDHPYGIRMLCRSCGAESGASLWHLLIDTPAAARFWRRHPRMHALPVREVESDGIAALVSGFASSDGARLEIVSARHTYDILHVAGDVHR